MEKLKGLILSGGAGTRLRPITHTSAKQLVPVANKPVLFYGIEALVDAGVTEIGIIIAPQTGDEIREAAGDGSQFGAEITYIPQAEPLGLAHAVLTAEEFLGDDSFVMYLGDNLLRDGIQGLVDAFRRDEPDALILLTQVSDPEHYGVAELDGERIVRLVEKPKDPPSNLALVGVYMFTSKVLEAAKAIEPSPRGELEITDTIQHLIDTGHTVEQHRVKGWWKDTGQLADMLEANRLVLEDIEPRIDGELIDSKVEGRVVIEKGARVVNSQVRGPAVIAAGSTVSDSYVGPYTAIHTDCVISNSEIEHSILLSGASIRDLPSRMEASLLGRDVRIGRAEGLPKTLRMLVGDKSEVTLPVRITVAGSEGMLAREVVGAAERRGHEVDAPNRGEMDITDPASIDEALEEFRPDAVINCAAWSDVDGAEDDERGAMKVNDTGAALLAAGAARVGASVLYPSSDYVFDGTGRTPYLEDHMPNPVNAYGRSKLGGEVSVAVANPNHFIVRTSWLFGVGGKNFVETMLRIGAEREEILVVSDQRGCPTSCVDLGDGMVQLAETDHYGIHHMRGGGECTWFDFAAEIFDQAQMETRVMSATTEMMARKAPRPAYSVLGHGRDDAIELPEWQDSLRRYLDDRELVK